MIRGHEERSKRAREPLTKDRRIDLEALMNVNFVGLEKVWGCIGYLCVGDESVEARLNLRLL